jgi:hypothetical protein
MLISALHMGSVWFRKFYDCYSDGLRIKCTGPYDAPNRTPRENNFKRGHVSKLVCVHPFLPVKWQVWWQFARVSTIKIDPRRTDV